MNKRAKKKFGNKYRAKTYLTSRMNRLFKIMDLVLTEEEKRWNNILHIVDSKRMDLKHPIKVEILKNCRPAPTRSSNEVTDNEFTINFQN